MSNTTPKRGRLGIPEIIEVRRSDPVYMAHAYLTKVPVPAIAPFIEAFTSPGDVVLDPFAGSGMTGVAAAATSRRARLFDVSVLGRHIGSNYVNLVDPDHLRKRADEMVLATQERLGDVYSVECVNCRMQARLVKTVWSVVIECDACGDPVNFYEALERADWDKKNMRCPSCAGGFSTRGRRVGEQPVIDSIACNCASTQMEQPWSPVDQAEEWSGLEVPDLPISEDRQMYVASALGRHDLTTTGSFFSPRNLAVLAVLKDELERVPEADLRDKLRFAFTAILTRASKRYQWSRKRPLNAANSNYYVAPVFYEWNVYDLFGRKVEAAIKADEWIREARGMGTLFEPGDIDVRYDLATARELPLEDDSVDYVFMDPPFGSNIFYSDMNLFQEAWLGQTTDPSQEAVVDRVDTGMDRTPERYEDLLKDAFSECKRVVKPGGAITIIFGNSSGAMWALLQRAIAGAGLAVDPELITILDKGQRSVKGLASGFENVATLDLVLTLRAAEHSGPRTSAPSTNEVESIVDEILSANEKVTPSHVYLELLKAGIHANWDLSTLDLKHVSDHLHAAERDINRKTAEITS